MKTAEKLKGLKAYDPTEDIYRIKLDANESPFAPPDEIKKALAEAVCDIKLNRYPDPDSAALKKAASKRFGVPTDMICAGTGSDELINLVLGGLCQRGGKVMLTAPDFSMYGLYAEIAELKKVYLQKNEEMEITADEIIEAAKSEKPDVIIFSNPCNPTGKGLGRPEVLKLARSVESLVVVDEAYMDFWDQSILPDIAGIENAIILRTCSKAYSMAAVRLGFAIAAPEIIRSFNLVRSPFNINSITQKAGELILSDSERLDGMTKRVIRQKKELHASLSEVCGRSKKDIRVLESSTNFVVLMTKDSEEIYRELLSDGICVRKFSGFLRITAGTKEENAEVVSTISRII